MKPLKPFMTYEQQVAHLKEAHGLIVKDETRAMSLLSKVNYYRLSAYGISLRDPENKDHYKPGATFEQIVSLYNFDSILRAYLFLPVSEIEIRFRTKVAYRLGERFGPEGYTSPENFLPDVNPTTNVSRHEEFISNLNKEIDRQITLPCVIHHIDVYGGHFPIWAAIELMSFGEVVSLFTIMFPEDQIAIAKDFHTDRVRLKSWMLSLLEIRNICAHSNRLYNMPLKQMPRLYNEDLKYIRTNKLFPSILVLKKLLSGEAMWDVLIESLEKLIESTPDVDINCLGFPLDWKEACEIKVNG